MFIDYENIEIKDNRIIEIRDKSAKTAEIFKNHLSSKNNLDSIKSDYENFINDELLQCEHTLSSKREFTYKNKLDDFFLMKNILSTNRSESQKLNRSKSILVIENQQIKQENEIEKEAYRKKINDQIIKNANNSDIQINNKNISNNSSNQNSSQSIHFSMKNDLIWHNKKMKKDSDDDCPENIFDSLIRSDSNNSAVNSPNEDIYPKRDIKFNNCKEENFVFSKILINDNKNIIDRNSNKIFNLQNTINKEKNISNEVEENGNEKSSKSKIRITAIKPGISNKARKASSEIKNKENSSKEKAHKVKEIPLAKPRIDVKKNTINKFEISKRKVNNTNNSSHHNNNPQEKIDSNLKSNQNYKIPKKNFKESVQSTSNINNTEDSNQLIKNKINGIYITNKKGSIERNSKQLENLNSENSQDNIIKNLYEQEYHLNNIKNINNLNNKNLHSLNNSNSKININYNVNYNINYNFKSNDNINEEVVYNNSRNRAKGLKQSINLERAFFPSTTKAESVNNYFFTYNNKLKSNKNKESLCNKIPSNTNNNKNESRDRYRQS